IEKNLVKKILPYKPEEDHILIYEKLVNIKAFQDNQKIAFILEIPLVEPKICSYFHLYSFPINHDSLTYQMIIPSHKYLYLNELYFSLTDSPCKETLPGQYICTLPETSQIRNAPCEVQLLKFSKKYENCKLIHIKLQDPKIQKINKNQIGRASCREKE